MEAAEKLVQDAFRISLEQYRALARVHTYQELIGILAILKTKNFKSTWRKNLDKQIRDWLSGLSTYYRPLPVSVYKAIQPEWKVSDIDAIIRQINQLTAPGNHVHHS